MTETVRYPTYIIDFVVHTYVTKYEDRQIRMHPDFEAVCAKFWQMMAYSKNANNSCETLSKKQYKELHSRILKLLAPLYRAKEMEQVVEQDWLLDSYGQEFLNINLFQKYLFRIAHYWCVNIDLAEYCHMLNQIFDRITAKKIVRFEGKVDLVKPMIQVEVSQAKSSDEDSEEEENQEEEADWEQIQSDEEQVDGYEYEIKEDGYRYKREVVQREQEQDENQDNQKPVRNEIFFVARDPIFFEETVIFYHKINGGYTVPPRTEDFEYQILADFEDVFPIGYPTEQFLAQTKTDVYKAQLKIKEDKKQAVAAMKTAIFDINSVGQPQQNVSDRDPGLLPEKFEMVELPFKMYSSTQEIQVKTIAKIQDNGYNSLRIMFKEASDLQLRPKINKVQSSSKIKGKININNPITVKSLLGYNPALERRVNYRLSKDVHSNKIFVNVNYLIEDPVYETAYRSDVRRIETSEKLALKPDEEFRREEEFCNVTTPYSKAVQIMLQKKFESLFTLKLQGDSDKAVERDNMVLKEERSRLKKSKLREKLSTKLPEETHEETLLLKQLQGPFYQLLSNHGSKRDDFNGPKNLIEQSRQEKMRVLVIGKPRSGKTTLTKELEKSLNLVRVSVDNWLANLFKKIKDREENPPEEEPEPELEEGQERPPKKSWMEPLDELVYNKLRQGDSPIQEDIDQMLIEMVNSPQAKTRGFVLDLDYTADSKQSMKQRLLEINLLAGKNFTHVIEIDIENDEVRQRAQNLRFTLADGVVYSRFEREERKKPKKVVNEDEEPADEEEDEKSKPFVEKDLAIRECDAEDNIHDLLKQYNSVEQPEFDEFVATQTNNTYFKIKADGLTVEELAQAVTYKLKPNTSQPQMPVAIQIENGSDFKSLLTEGIDPEDGTLPRQWSLWKTIDPVELQYGKVVVGVPEFTCHFANNVFVFKDEANMRQFLQSPNQYLVSAPKMPENYRIMIIGPKGSGYQKLSQQLSEKYGLRIVNFRSIVSNKMQEIFASTTKLPNNVSDRGPCKLTISDQELQEIKDGKSIASWKFLPWVLEYLGVPLMEKPQPKPEDIVEPDVTQMTDEERKAYEKEQKKKNDERKKKEKEEEETKKAKAERAAKRQEAREQGLDLEELGLQDSEEEIKIPDLTLDKLVPKVDDDGKLPVFGRYILEDFPITEIFSAKMKEYGFGLEKVIYLSDQSEEPGAEIKLRNKGGEIAFDYDKEMEIVTKALNVIKDGQGDDSNLVKEINCVNQSEIFIRTLTEIDPFYTLPDTPEENRNTADDVNIDDEIPENTKWLPKSDFGDYCAVSFVKHGFLIKGSKEFECTVQGKTFWFCGENELNEFKFNPGRFLTKQNQPLIPPKPKILVIGQKGAGTTTQVAKLCAKYKIESLQLASEVQKTLKQEKENRKRLRLLKRGFRPPAYTEEGAEPEPDPEIEEDPEDFDRADNEKKIIQRTIHSNNGLVIDGCWTSLPDDTVTLPLHELLFESRRTPEVVIVLRCKEETTFKRCIDDKAIKAKYDEIVKQRKEAKDKQREEDKKTKHQELMEENKQDPEAEDRKSDEQVREIVRTALEEWERQRIEDDKQAEEDDPDKPVLEDMMNEAKTKLTELRDKDEAMLNEFVEYLNEKKVRIIDKLQTEVSADYVHIKIVEQLKDIMVTRDDLVERDQCRSLKPEEVKNYEKSYTYSHSQFGLNSPINPFNPEKSKQFAVLYREKIYFLASEEERQKFKLTPSKYAIGSDPVPQDVQIKPAVCVIGLPKSGKSQLCQTLSKRTNAVHIEPESIIDFFIKRDCVFSQELRNRMFEHGRDIDDAKLLDLILRRVQMRDCLENGWILENYPKTRAQARDFVTKIKPSNVIYLQVPCEDVYKRTANSNDFISDRTVLVRHLNFLCKNVPQTAIFFQKYYNSLTCVDALKSCWYVEERALEAIELTLGARMRFARDLYHKYSETGEDRCCIVENINYDRCYFKKSISQFGYKCPVSWKLHKKYVNCCQRPEYCVFFQDQFYYFAGPIERQIFIDNPLQFTEKVFFSTIRNVPAMIRQHKASEIVAQEKALQGYCAVTLRDENKIQKGDPLVLINYKDQRYAFLTQEKALKFLLDPSRYSNVQLPVKMPAGTDQVPLFALQKKAESITFMEQALSSVVTRGLREVGENRLKYPTLSVKETMLKLFAIFLKAENPANTEYMREKYRQKMKEFIFKCEVPSELHQMAEEKQEKINKDRAWPQFKEDYFNQLGQKYDQIMHEVIKERTTGFSYYIK